MKAFLLWTHIVVKVSSRRLADDVKKNAKKCAPHVQHDAFFLWFDQSYVRFVTMQREACNVIKYADIDIALVSPASTSSLRKNYTRNFLVGASVPK